jgi:DNA helicase-2/ATP-dependent DNA helicase PcrA
MSEIIITSKTVITDFDKHIKVAAGPGAGKTTWLVQHIRHVLNNSDRLKISRKIACITYTNVAVETVIKRLGDAVHQVEVSTIHSFLYKHLIKPYISFIANEYAFNVVKLKGHDDTILSNYSFLEEWKERTKQKRITDTKKVVAAFGKLKWKLESDGTFTLKPEFPITFPGFSVTNASYLEYKKMAWEKGVLHHDDVLFFSYQLIQKYPFVLEVLRAKFPYFFIDEFQDIHPIQLFIVRKLAEKETTIVAVGDNAQSIYSFMGAVSGQFTAFALPGLMNYKILDNWRSTDKIIDLLNIMRKDITQKGGRKVAGAPPLIILGDKIKALDIARTKSGDDNICTLSRDNILSNSMRKGLTQSISANLLDELNDKDSNKDRKNAVIAAVRSIEFAQQGYFKDALKAIGREFDIAGQKATQRHALMVLKKLLDNRALFQGEKLMALYDFINTSSLKKLSKFTGPNPKSFYETYNYQELSTAVQQLNEATIYRTIHKAKGDEFNAVLLVIDVDKKGKFNETEELKFILAPDLSDEEHRVRYVALSRAMNYLYINIPSITAVTKTAMESLGISVE